MFIHPYEKYWDVDIGDKYFATFFFDRDFQHFSSPLNRGPKQKARLGDRLIDWIPTILS